MLGELSNRPDGRLSLRRAGWRRGVVFSGGLSGHLRSNIALSAALPPPNQDCLTWINALRQRTYLKFQESVAPTNRDLMRERSKVEFSCFDRRGTSFVGRKPALPQTQTRDTEEGDLA